MDDDSKDNDNDDRTFDQMEIAAPSDGDEAADEYLETSSVSSSEASELSCSFDLEMDECMWSPPEALDSEDDMCSVANLEEEDGVFGDTGIPSSCMATFGEEESESYHFKEEKRKLLREVRDAEFKAFVAQLLRFFDTSTSEQDDDAWVDVIATLAWKAAAFVKVEALEEHARNMNHYVKITCVAYGTRSQSQLVQGQVFKKHAVHKHMPTEFKNPRLLLVRGLLGHSSTGLTSFDTMLSTCGASQLNALAQHLEMSGANVIMAEKAVSRDLVEFILDYGLRMTIVSNVKLHRLERVARCTGSPILSADNILSQNLGQCSSIVFRKIVEEHDHENEGGRRPRKTLMYIQGCPTRLGCTIVLKGSHTEELKKIKRVVRAAVFKAYHLIRDISFRMDLHAMFSTYSLLLDNGDSASSSSRSASLKEVAVDARDVTCESEDGTRNIDLTLRISGLHSKVVLMTVLNFSRGIVCDHGKCFHTNFTLAKYLRNSLLNQDLKCKTCREQAEAHIYYYAHNNQQLAVRVQQLPADKQLPGAEHQKVWFWNRCAKCKVDDDDEHNSSKRLLISDDALGLLFGRFLELHFSKPSPFDVSSVCGHSSHKDFLLFVGSGTMVAVFKYSPMAASEIWGPDGTGIGEFANLEILPLLGMLMSCCDRKRAPSQVPRQPIPE